MFFVVAIRFRIPHFRVFTCPTFSYNDYTILQSNLCVLRQTWASSLWFQSSLSSCISLQQDSLTRKMLHHCECAWASSTLLHDPGPSPAISDRYGHCDNWWAMHKGASPNYFFQNCDIKLEPPPPITSHLWYRAKLLVHRRSPLLLTCHYPCVCRNTAQWTAHTELLDYRNIVTFSWSTVPNSTDIFVCW